MDAAACGLAEATGYSDLKDAVADCQSAPRARLYSRVWQMMPALQEASP